MSNSAHQGITLTIPEETIDSYTQLLANMKQGQSGDALKIMNLIAKIAKAALHGDAHIERTLIKLTHVQEEVSLVFSVDVLQKKGWLEELEKVGLHYYDEDQLTAIHSALLTQEFELSFTRPEYSGKQLNALYEQMDLFTIGRPSTLPAILATLEESQLIEIDEEQNEIKITEKGLIAYLTLLHHRPDIATPAFCVELTTLQNQIANDEITVTQAMKKILPKITADSSAGLLADQIWDDITELYAPQPLVSKQALISTRSRF